MPVLIDHASSGNAQAATPGDGSAPPALCWNLRRNIAMTPRVFMLHVGTAAGLSCTIGIGFLIVGYPVVFGFCILQALALAGAVIYHAIHALDGEQLVLAGELLEVRTTRGLRSTTVRLNPCWTRLECRANAGPPALCSGRTRVPVAVYLADPQRRRFAADFRRVLAGVRTPASTR
ncbi:DUF2244 domain-containing protein [Variovorax sp. Root318D1]|uniref:DUF2244 domain-containing protein n=1 Tax=Variovorax sp. Root318D1 TaxID=1736513 RepID=UPI0009E95AC5|nr:DUF2244 domain-containing protein [Variovorax sp. Root318D1]